MSMTFEQYDLNRPVQEFTEGIKQICYPLPENWVELTKSVEVPFNVAFKVFMDWLALFFGYVFIGILVILFIIAILYTLWEGVVWIKRLLVR